MRRIYNDHNNNNNETITENKNSKSYEKRGISNTAPLVKECTNKNEEM